MKRLLCYTWVLEVNSIFWQLRKAFCLNEESLLAYNVSPLWQKRVYKSMCSTEAVFSFSKQEVSSAIDWIIGLNFFHSYRMIHPYCLRDLVAGRLFCVFFILFILYFLHFGSSLERCPVQEDARTQWRKSLEPSRASISIMRIYSTW